MEGPCGAEREGDEGQNPGNHGGHADDAGRYRRATASEDKLAENNLRLVLQVLECAKLIRENTGFGTIELDIKDGLVVYRKVTIRDHIR